MNLSRNLNKVGIVGAGAMGSGIAQIASQAGHHVVVFDLNQTALDTSSKKLSKVMNRLIEKGAVSESVASDIQERITRTTDISQFKDCGLVIEAVVEDLNVKHSVFAQVEDVVGADAIIASNTSSLSITTIAAGCKHPERVVGLHFFNPAPLMPLVEIIPALQTRDELDVELVELMTQWGKSPVITKDTPGFIVNRVARPYYGEAMRILDEGLTDVSTIDEAMRSLGFRMGPFELTDLIGHDVNYAVTESVFKAFYYDPRFKPSITQLKLVEAGWLGRKTGRGFYKYAEDGSKSSFILDNKNDLKKTISERIIAMLINEAADAVFWGIASVEDIDTAMTKGVNYPKGLLVWADEWGAAKVIDIIEKLRDNFGETRYRVSPKLRELAATGKKFYN
jgi:3-hydroxybutyryl-CoA dehydrogenase|tara:strand:+ start:433 stop:1614 length:1182 start_codon:yes stop_codon:yes gene_type:complete